MRTCLSNIEDWAQLARECKFSPELLAACCRVSLRTLQRFFQAKFHQTPEQWLMDLRCHLAAEAIAQGFSTAAAAADYAFADAPHFCREFKKRFKMSPQEYSFAYCALRLRLSFKFNNVAVVQSTVLDKSGL